MIVLNYYCQFPTLCHSVDAAVHGLGFTTFLQPFLLEGMRVKMASLDHYGPSVFLLLHPSEEKEMPLRAESDNDRWALY